MMMICECGEKMEFVPFCCAKRRLGFEGKFVCRNCKKAHIVDRKEFEEIRRRSENAKFYKKDIVFIG